MAEWALLAGLDDEDRRRVLAAARRRRFARREVVFHEGDPGESVHLIGKGRVAVRSTTGLGDTVTLAVLCRGEAFGEMALVAGDNVRSASVVALEPTETLMLDRRSFDQLRREYPTVDRFLIQLLTEQVRRLTGQVLEALHVPVDTRVVRRLLDLAERYGDDEPAATIPLTQEELAGLAGASRPTVNRVLRSLEDAGAARLGRGRIEILDEARLRRLAR